MTTVKICGLLDCSNSIADINYPLDKVHDFVFLLVDDDVGTRGLLARSLRDDGWNVLQADNGRQALDILKTHTPRLIFLDLLMPVMSGMEFLKEYRSSGNNANIDVVVLTSKELTGEERKDLQANDVQVITKQTFSLQQLLDEVRLHVSSEV